MTVGDDIEALKRLLDGRVNDYAVPSLHEIEASLRFVASLEGKTAVIQFGRRRLRTS